MIMCLAHNVTDRASAWEVEVFLKTKLEKSLTQVPAERMGESTVGYVS